MLQAPHPDGRAVRRYAAPLLILALLAGMMVAVPASAETTAAPEPATVAVEARAPLTGPEALIGTIGFRGTSDNPAFAGRYVTTGISPVVDSEGIVVDLRHDRKVKARDNANPVIFELGLFRDAGGRFRLLGENGLWVALKTPAAFPDGIFMAGVGKWRAAWGFKAVRPTAIDPVAEDKLAESGIDPGLPICLEAYQGRSYRGLATLDLQGYLVLDPDGVCGADILALFITDDLPQGSDVADLRRDPTTPVDPITKARFAPPDRPALTLTSTERDDAVDDINTYFSDFQAMTGRIYVETRFDLIDINTYLSVTSLTIPGEEAEEIDWYNFGFNTVENALQFIPVVGSMAAAVVDQYSMYIDIGITLYQNSELEGPRVIDKVTNFQVAQYADLVAKLRAEKTRTTRNLQMLNLMLTEGCPDPAHCVSDRRLAQWLQDGLAFPVGTSLYEDRRVLAWRKTFYERLLPVRGRLVGWWINVPNEHYDRPFTLEESLGDGQKGFGTEMSGKPWAEVVMFSSVWMPWDNHIEHYEFPGWDTHHRPIATAWVIGLAGTETEPDTLLVGPTYQHITRALFDPISQEEPLEGGLGLSYKEVACEWLRGQTPQNYWYESHWYHPCHFSFYDPGAATPMRVNNTARWANFTDANSVATYDGNGNAIAWFPPDRTEQAGGRSAYDPEIFSWQIPHLGYGSCADTPWDRSTATGAPASVYFANLTDVPVRVRRINPDGTRTLIPDPDGTAELELWTALGHPAAGSGTIPYDATTDTMFRVDSHVGAVYLVQRADNNACVGIYSVGEPPPDAVPYQVAEIHGHGEGAGGILDH